MEEVIKHLYVGGDRDYEELKDKPEWSFLRCCKYGPGGHQDILHYTTQAAPQGPHYLWAVERGHKNHMALNLIDRHDPNYIAPEMIQKGLDFIKDRLALGEKVLVACNHGHSRGPTVALMFLRSIGEMPSGFMQSERIFHTLYPEYEPNQGIRQFARSAWDRLDKDRI